MSRPRVVFLTSHGMTLRLLMKGQLEYLADRGLAVIAASSPGPDLEAVARRAGVRAVAVPGLCREVAPLTDLRVLWRLVGLLSRLAPDLVVAGTPKAGLLGTLAARLARVPRVLYVLRGLRLETASGARRLLLGLSERLACRAAHRVLCVSPSLGRRAVEMGLVSPQRLQVPGPGSSNGVDVEHFRPATSVGASVSPELPDGVGPVIGFVGRFTRDKGIEDLATAFLDGVLPRFPHARLLLLGDWEEGDPVATAVRDRLVAHPAVLRPGFVADTAPYYRCMDVLAFPSYREGFPNAPLEAAASGVPTVGYAATGTVDAVLDGLTGSLVPVGDVAGLTAALMSYLGSVERRRCHGVAARRRAVDCFRDRDVWRAWCDEYLAELGMGSR